MKRKDYVKLVFNCEGCTTRTFQELKEQALTALQKDRIYFECISPGKSGKKCITPRSEENQDN